MSAKNHHGITRRVLVKHYAEVVTDESTEKFVQVKDGYYTRKTILADFMENVNVVTLRLDTYSTFNMKNGSLWPSEQIVVTV